MPTMKKYELFTDTKKCKKDINWKFLDLKQYACISINNKIILVDCLYF